MEKVKTIEHAGLKINIYADESPESLREWSNLGTIVYAHRHYCLGDEDIRAELEDFDGWEEYRAHLIKERDALVILPVYLYDHSGQTIRTTPFGDRWDSGQVGFIYATRAKIMEEFSEQFSLPKVTEILESEIKDFDTYIRGEVYGYMIELPDGTKEGGCWGFLGDYEESGLIDEAKAEAEGIADTIAQHKKAEAMAYDEAARDSIVEQIKGGAKIGTAENKNGKTITWYLETKTS